MAKSISQAQADALADGFFDKQAATLEGKEGIRPRNSLSVLFRLAGGLVESAQNNLIASNSIASGKLSDSLKVVDPVKRGNEVTVDISMLFYGQFVNKGVRGTKSGSGQYSFKYDNPGKKMVKAINSWMKRGGRSVRTVKKTKTGVIGRQETKNKSISELSSAYAVARSIKQKGIKKTGFMDKAIETTRNKARDQLGKAFKADIIAALPKKI